jgi:hypothetical protein
MNLAVNTIQTSKEQLQQTIIKLYEDMRLRPALLLLARHVYGDTVIYSWSVFRTLKEHGLLTEGRTFTPDVALVIEQMFEMRDGKHTFVGK